MKVILLMLLTSSLIIGGQSFWKVGIEKNGGLLNPASSLWGNVVSLVFSLYMIGGALVYMVATVLFLYMLDKYEYSFIAPALISMAQVMVMLAAIFFFKETISVYRWFGVGLVVCGIFFMAR